MAYDIADPHRLRKVIGIMESYGTRLQYSVFLCDLSVSERLAWRAAIDGATSRSEDSIISIDLGPTANPKPIETIGRPRTLPPRPGQII